MQDQKFVSLFPSNVNHYLHNLVFDSQKNKGVEAKVFITLKQYLKKKNIIINTYDIKILWQLYVESMRPVEN